MRIALQQKTISSQLPDPVLRLSPFYSASENRETSGPSPFPKSFVDCAKDGPQRCGVSGIGGLFKSVGSRLEKVTS